MNDLLKIESILGIVANENHLRARRDGKEYEELIPAPSWSEEIVIRNGSVTDTVKAMKRLIEQYSWQTAKVAPLLKGRNTYETCKNVWNFLYDHIKYKEDDEGKEQLRTPARSWAQRLTRGIDCDDFTIFAGCLLRNLGISDYIRIARYMYKTYFQHVYMVVPVTNRRYITVDPVLDEFDAEKEPAEVKDFLQLNNKTTEMSTTNLNGIDISVLGGVEDNTLNEMAGIISGLDFKEVSELEGLGAIGTEEQELGAIRNHLVRTRNFVSRRPWIIKEVEHPGTFLGMVDYALKYWDTDNRDRALAALESQETRMNELEGLGSAYEGHEDVELLYGLNESGSYNVLGKAKRERKFFTKVRSATKQAGKGIKKLAKGIVRYNPASVSIRASVLLALKVNLLKVSSKLKWGYLTESEASAKGFNLNEWRKLKDALQKAEGMFVKVLAGKAENFKRAILSGRAGGLNGFEDNDFTNGVEGFGVVAETASVTAAVPFLTKILALLKKVDFQKLGTGIKAAKGLFKRKNHAADKDAPTEENGSALPEGGEASDPPTDKETTSTNDNSGGGSQDTNTNDNGAGDTSGSGNNTSDTNTNNNASTTSNPDNSNTNTGSGDSNSGGDANNENPNPDNLPATTNARGVNPIAKTEPSPGTMATVMEFVKEHKTPIIVTLGGLALLWFANRGSKPQLSGKRGGKKKSGKAKTNPPKTITGVKSKTKAQTKPKGKRKGKGGTGKSVTL